MPKRHATSPIPSQSSSSSISSPKKPRSSEFFKEGMRDLNTAFQSAMEGALSKDPACSMVPLVEDYLKYTQALMLKSMSSLTNGGGTTLPPPSSSSSSSLTDLGEFFDDFKQRCVNFVADSNMDPEDDANNNNLKGLLAAIPQKTASKVNPTPTMAMSSSSFGTTRPPALKPVAEEEEEPSPLKLKAAPSIESAAPSNFKGFSSTPRAPPPTPNTPVPGVSSVAFNFGSSSVPSFGISGASPSPSATATTAHSLFPVAQSKVDTQKEDEEENEEPPENELVRVTENDAVYSIRCKVFGMVNNQYKDKGVGTLYVKILSEGKYQVVVRADNNLGTLILNILLNKSLPLEKKSAKDVMTVDIMGNKGNPMPILLRVKSEEDANELLSQLKEFQQQSSN
ncbi:unnamed protein product [Orchesella dallaii]|uniref:RanBD1 domain-containing protein n=1 Tax=Orchesella dallaii TaxID=48710 RepID=A0ABP1RAW6_9HEXA